MVIEIFGNYISKCPNLMKKRTPVPAYILLLSLSNKLKLLVNHYGTPCIILECSFIDCVVMCCETLIIIDNIKTAGRLPSPAIRHISGKLVAALALLCASDLRNSNRVWILKNIKLYQFADQFSSFYRKKNVH